jgi:hypothetical protein
VTTPNGSAPDGAYVVGGQYGQDITEASAKAIMTGKTKTAFGNAQNQHKINVGNPLTALFGLASGLRNDVDASTVNQIKLENRVESLISGGTRYTYMLNATWTNPGPGKIVGVACFNGGCGGSGQSSTLNIGGRGAKYVYQEFKSDDLPATVAITVGAAGAVGSTGIGGTSKFGTFLQGSFDGGGIMTPQGVMASGGDAGDGGFGDYFEGSDGPNNRTGTAGGGNALAAGGTYNPTSNGGQGADAPTNKVAVAGGGGGGGAGRPVVNSTRSAGAGGWPGGGGGAAGYSNVLVSSKNGAAGAPGAVFVTVRG